MIALLPGCQLAFPFDGDPPPPPTDVPVEQRGCADRRQGSIMPLGMGTALTLREDRQFAARIVGFGSLMIEAFEGELDPDAQFKPLYESPDSKIGLGISPAGDEIVFGSIAGMAREIVRLRREPAAWVEAGTLTFLDEDGSPIPHVDNDHPSSPTRTDPPRMILNYSVGFDEFERVDDATWRRVARYAGDALGEDIHDGSLSPDGLRLVFVATDGIDRIFLSERESPAERFATATTLFADTRSESTPYLTADCSALFFSVKTAGVATETIRVELLD